MPSRHPLPKLNSSKIEDFRNLRELVTDRLRDAIALGELKPGQVLRQEALAAELRVSRQPIREAVRVLEHEGLIVRHGRSGLMVAPLTRTEIRDLYEFRAVLEQLVAERAVNGLSPDQILTIETIFRHAEDALSARDEARLIELDRAFHSELYIASGNAVVRDTLARHWTDLARAMRIVLEVPGYPSGPGRNTRPSSQLLRGGTSSGPGDSRRSTPEALGLMLSSTWNSTRMRN